MEQCFPLVTAAVKFLARLQNPSFKKKKKNFWQLPSGAFQNQCKQALNHVPIAKHKKTRWHGGEQLIRLKISMRK